MRRFLTAAVAASALFAVSAPAMAQGINARQAQLEQRINQGLRGGGLTAGEAQQLRNEFRALQGLERQYRLSGGGISSTEQAELMTRFNILDARIFLSRVDRDYARNWSGINARQAELDRRIDVGVRNGQLTRAEALRLRAEFKQIAMLENQYRVSGRFLSLAERRDLDNRMNALNRRIMNNRQDAQGVQHPSGMGINARQAQLEARISQGVRGGGLTAGEAQQLRNEFRALQGLERQYRMSGGGISAAEQAELMTRFNILDARIFLSRIDRDYARNWSGINARQAEVDRRIDVRVRNGQLTRAEAVRLRAEFKQIAMLENQYRMSGRFLTLAERRDLDRRLDALNRRINAAAR